MQKKQPENQVEHAQNKAKQKSKQMLPAPPDCRNLKISSLKRFFIFLAHPEKKYTECNHENTMAILSFEKKHMSIG